MTLIVLLAIIIDAILGEPKKYHPLVGFGNSVLWLENKLWQDNKLYGVYALVIVLLFMMLLASLLLFISQFHTLFYYLLSIAVLYLAIAPRSLIEHAEAIYHALSAKDIDAARHDLSMIVSRDTKTLEESDIASACCESVLENGSDGIFAAIFWFCIAGFYGVLIYRVVNTLDAMWGYKNTRYHQFGWAAAKLDDLLNYFPARLVAISYALMGHFNQAMECWRQQAPNWKSPNAGPVMSAGAGSLNIMLGGEANYDGATENRPVLGCGNKAMAEDIKRALALVKRTLILWLVVIAIIELL